jgi:uncharacterized protein with GYD domain
MSKYLWEVSYSPEGAKGLLKDGGSKRRAAAEQAIKQVGGKLEAFYFAFGKHDAYIIADIPDNASEAAASLAVNASGAVAVRTTIPYRFIPAFLLVGLFVWLFVRVCWMLDSVFPTATRATYCLGIFEPKLEREILLAQPSEIQTQGKHGITLPCRNAQQAKSKSSAA